MRDYGKVPWHQLREYLFLVSSYKTRRELMHIASVEIQKIIPFDTAAVVCDTSDARYLAGIGQGDAVNKSYNDYYRTRQPYFLSTEGKDVDWDIVLALQNLDWRKFGGLEFAVDFMMPNRMCKSLAVSVPEHRITLSIHRSRTSPDFTTVDIDSLGVVNDYLNALYLNFDQRLGIPDATFSAKGIAEKFPLLSRREAEVCSLVALRLSTYEIGRCLFLGRRTVEKYIESIFEKLAVRSREQLRWRLGVVPPTEL